MRLTGAPCCAEGARTAGFTKAATLSAPEQGGRRDRSDADVVETALRETQEEVGVAVPRECVLARLEPLGSRHGLRVHPVLAAVAFDPVAAARPNAAEVSAVFDAPLDLFLTPQPDCHRTVDLALDRHTRFRAHFFRSGGHTVWGLTALALILAARAALGRRASFRVGHPAAIPTRPRPRL